MEKQVKQHFGYVLSICARNQILNIRRIKFVNTVMLIELEIMQNCLLDSFGMPYG